MTDNYFTNHLLYATDISKYVSIIQQLVLTIHNYMDNHIIWSYGLTRRAFRSVILSLMVIHRIHRIVSNDSHIHPSVAYV